MTHTEITNHQIENQFLDACSKGSLRSVEKIYNDYYLHHKSFYKKVLSFLKLSKLPSIVLNPHCQANLPFRYASFRGNADIVHFLLNDEYFIRKIQQTELLECFATAISVNDTNILKVISPFIFKNDSISMNIKKGYLEACKNGLWDAVKYTMDNFDIDNSDDIYINADKNSKHFFEYAYASLKDQGFITACESNQIEFVKNMLEDKDYLISINKKPTLIDALGNSISSGHIDISKYLISKVKEKSQYYYDTICLAFVFSCNKGDINTVKSLLEDKDWNFDSTLFKTPYYVNFKHCKSTIPIQDGFNNAFENARLEIVKYLTSQPKSAFYVDIKNLEGKINSKLEFTDVHFEIMKYFIFQLDFKKQDSFMVFPKEINELFEKKHLQEQLSDELVDSTNLKKNIKQVKI